MLNKLKQDLQKLANPQKAKLYMRFFKTGRGEYGEGDKFLGLTVPQQRKIVRKYLAISLKELKQLLQSKIHEYRLVALLILVSKFKKAKLISQLAEQKEIFDFYLKHTKFINNWDLVDLSAKDIIGQYVLDNPEEKSIIYNLAKSTNLWEKRISVLACFAFIRQGKFKETLKIAKMLLKDKHDLIHKAVGWMLREVGKKNQQLEEEFLSKYYRKMPRTMLRYAIEKFDLKKREYYLKK